MNEKLFPWIVGITCALGFLTFGAILAPVIVGLP